MIEILNSSGASRNFISQILCWQCFFSGYNTCRLLIVWGKIHLSWKCIDLQHCDLSQDLWYLLCIKLWYFISNIIFPWPVWQDMKIHICIFWSIIIKKFYLLSSLYVPYQVSEPKDQENNEEIVICIAFFCHTLNRLDPIQIFHKLPQYRNI